MKKNLAVFVLQWVTGGIFGAMQTKYSIGRVNSSLGNASDISADHVTLFFDHRVRYHTHESDFAYTKGDLAIMVKTVSKRFHKLLIDTAPKLESIPPKDTAPSRVWIPSVVAQHNRNNLNATALEVIVSFEFDVNMLYGDHTYTESSFDVAKYMADTANQIHPGTVKTLMMTMYHTDKLEYADESYDYSYFQYMQDWQDEDHVQLMYVERIHHLAWPYQLGVFMDVHDCGKYRGHLPDKVKQILPYVELVGLFIDPTTFHHLTTVTPEETHKMFIAKFEDCERKLREERPEIKVMPSSLWKSPHVTISDMVEDWQRMSLWAVKNNKEVVMYEAFDTPGGRDFYYWGHGWWRLKDRTSFIINETSFVEKIEDANSEIYTKHLYNPAEESFSFEEELDRNDSTTTQNIPNSSINCTKTSPNNTSTPTATSDSQAAPNVQYPPPTIIHTTTTASTNQALYIVLVFLSIICAVLVFTQVYFHLKVIKTHHQGLGHGAFRTGQNHCFVNPGLPSENSINSCPGTLMNQHYRPSHTFTTSSSANIHCCDDPVVIDNDGAASISGSLMEMTDTTPIVSVSYKKM